MKFKVLVATTAACMAFSATARSQVGLPRSEAITGTSIAWTVGGAATAVALTIFVNTPVGIISGVIVAAPIAITFGYTSPPLQKITASSNSQARHRVQLVKEDAATFLANQDAKNHEAPSPVLSELFEQIRSSSGVVVSDTDIARALVVAEVQE